MILRSLAFLAPFVFAQPALTPKDITNEILKDREDTRNWLKSEPTSYLAAIRRVDFGHKPSVSVGSAADNGLRLEGLASHELKISVQGEKFEVAAVDPEGGFRLKNGSATVRAATLGPSAIAVGRYTLRLSHQGYPAVIVFDPKSPRFKEYHGIEYFPIDLAYRYMLPLVPDAKGDNIRIESTHSAARHATRIGWFEFNVGKTPCRLAAYRLEEPGVEPDSISVFFRDATTGHESYKVGRYIEPKKLPEGRYVLDFNLAYNPACAFSSYYNCPVPPRENRLTVAIRAGERDSHYH